MLKGYRIQRIRELVDGIKAVNTQVSDIYGITADRKDKNSEITSLALRRKMLELELAKLGIEFDCTDYVGIHCLDIRGLEAVLDAIEGKR